MATKKSAIDFDALLADYDEDAEIERLVAETRVEHVIVEDRFLGRFTDKTLVEVPLRVTVEAIDELQNVEGVNNPVDQLKALLGALGDEATVNALVKRDIAEVAAFAEYYFEVLNKRAKASLPES